MAQYPDIAGGGRVDDTFLAAMIDNYVIKPANAAPRVNNTVVADPDLTFPVVAGGLYDVQFFVRFSGLLAAGIRTTWAVPAGTSGDRMCCGPGTANAAEATANTTTMRWIVYPYGTAVGYTNPQNSTSAQTWLMERGLIAVGATAGNVTFSWGQNVTNATGSIVFANSHVKYRRIG